MRILTRKLYRAFPELDAFTDEQCEALMSRLRGALMFDVGTALLVGLVVGVAVIPSFFLAAALLWLVRDVRGWASDALLLPPLVVFFSLPALAGIVTRDLMLRRRITRALVTTLLRRRCPMCSYLLLGQRTRDGAVTCPECGSKHLLVDMGITEADLIPPPTALVPLLKHD